jgi:hypothetical protein
LERGRETLQQDLQDLALECIGHFFSLQAQAVKDTTVAVQVDQREAIELERSKEGFGNDLKSIRLSATHLSKGGLDSGPLLLGPGLLKARRGFTTNTQEEATKKIGLDQNGKAASAEAPG